MLAVPTLAVTIRKKELKDDINKGDNDDEEVVFVLEKNIVKKKKVITGIQNDKFIEIKSGLIENETVVTGPYSVLTKELKDDQRVDLAKRQDNDSH